MCTTTIFNVKIMMISELTTGIRPSTETICKSVSEWISIRSLTTGYFVAALDVLPHLDRSFERSFFLRKKKEGDSSYERPTAGPGSITLPYSLRLMTTEP
jgi:hypothetical protein